MSSYGIQDKFIDNTDIKLKLDHRDILEKTEIDVNGKEENYEKSMFNSFYLGVDEKPAPVKLAAAKPIKWVTKDGLYLSIHYDWKADHLTMMLQGVDAEKLPLAK